MNEDVFNMGMRKYLKQVGVTSQRAIEEAVRNGLASGQLKGRKSVKARMVLTLEGLEGEHVVEGDIPLS